MEDDAEFGARLFGFAARIGSTPLVFVLCEDLAMEIGLAGAGVAMAPR